ncbi:MFS transporter [Bacillus sp. WMMC1349]|uniref:MFS transporter n=1 Tax=Bacillus sp. WMMC1349 TaxID=2736254 RepID=UPI0015524EF8|nr:MFS transporter [Bacillus sp. WMMC1349]NPC94167.1 MFS transporter [Bacillus sp. WMMC1349]
MKTLKLSTTFILYLVCLSAFFASLNQNIYSPIIPLIRDSFHVSVTMVNLSVSIFIFITAVMQIIIGSIVDFKGARFVVLVSMIITVFASMGCALAQDFTVFLIFRVLQALGTAALPLIAATTIGGLFEGTKRGSAMGTYQMLLSLAPAVAPLLGGFIGERFNYWGIFWFLTGISIILFLVNAICFPKEPTKKKDRFNAKRLLSHYGEMFKNKIGNAILILSFIIFFVYFSIIVYLPILLTDSYHLDLKIVGMLYLPIAVSTIVGSMVFKSIQKKISLQRLFVYGNLTAAGGIVFFGLTHTFSLFVMSIALIVFGITMGLIPPMFSTMITNEFEENRGSAIGVFNFIRYIGMASGPVISGYLLEKLSSVLIFSCLGALYAVVSLLMFAIMGNRLRKAAPKVVNKKAAKS